MEESLELRAEKMKCLSNLEFQLLQSIHINDNRSIAELYINVETSIHIHGLVGSERFCATLSKVISNVGRSYDEMPVFVRIGELSEYASPVTSAARLQPLDNCYVFVADAFEITITPSIENI